MAGVTRQLLDLPVRAEGFAGASVAAYRGRGEEMFDVFPYNLRLDLHARVAQPDTCPGRPTSAPLTMAVASNCYAGPALGVWNAGG